MRLRASVDLVEIADMVDALQAPLDENENGIRAGAARRVLLLDIIKTFIEPDSVASFAKVEHDLDASILSEMLNELVEEYTGAGNPTQEPSSSDGSSETGSSSTAGAPLEGSTP